MTVLLSIPMNEGKDVHLQTYTEDPNVNPSPAVIRSRCATPLAHGLEPGEDAWSFEQVEDTLYVTNGRTRMQAFDGEEVTRASLAPPVGELAIESQRIALRVRDQGRVTKFEGDAAVAVGPPSVLTITSIVAIDPTGWVPTQAIVGKVFVMPSNRYFSGVDGGDVIGIVDSVDSATQITVVPINDDGTTARYTAQQATIQEVACAIYDSDSLEDLSYATPYGDQRFQPHGGDEVSDGVDQDGEENPQAFEFAGSHAIQIPHESLDTPAVLQRGTVVDFKCYLRPTNLETGNDGRRIILRRQGDARAASFELSIVENGKVEFRFWDRSIEAYRSIRSIGRPFTEGQWHYFRWRYKFKAGGHMGRDSVGGWETDHRLIHRGPTRFERVRQYRDAFCLWNLEGRDPEHPFLVMPGAHNGFGLDISAVGPPPNTWVNLSRKPGNVGHVLEQPWIGPEDTDPRYRTTTPGHGGIVSFFATIGASAASGGARRFPGTMLVAGSNGPEMWLARWMSLNRDVGVEDETGKTHIHGNNLYLGTTVPSPLASGIPRGQALLCYVFGESGQAPFGMPRILALQDVNNTDLTNVDPDSAENSTFTLTDDPLLGGDDGGALPNEPSTYVIAFAFPNGTNHAANATGNTSPFPTLLVHGENPVGVNDDPDPEELPWYIGGSPDEEEEGHALLGFEGMMDDVALSILEVDGTNIYSADQLMPDVEFNGPVEPRIHALPKLILDATTTPGDVAGHTVASPSWSSDLDAPSGGNTVTQIQGAGPGTILKLDTAVQERGKHRAVVTFYDPERGVESPASEIGLVEIAAQNDPTADERLDAAYKLRITRMPISADRRRTIWRRVYKTFANGSVFQRAAEVRDNRTQTIDLNPTATFLGTQSQVDFGYLEPPICSFIRTSERRMFFAGIRDAIRQAFGQEFRDTPTLVAWSDTFAPWKVPGTNREILESGEGNPVHSLVYLTGRMFALKADSLFIADELAESIRWRRVQANIGTVSPFGPAELEDYVALPSEKGIYALDASSRMLYISPEIEQTWRGLHAPALRYIHGVHNRQRNQYQLSARENLSNEYRILLTGEVADAPFSGAQDGIATAPSALRPIWSKQIHPVGIQALDASDDPFTDQRIVLLGSGMGFAMLMDVDSGVRGHEDGALYGDIRGAIDSVVSQGVWQLKDLTSVDTALDGLAGIPWVLTRRDEDNPAKELFLDQGVIFEIRDDLVLRTLRRQGVVTPLEDDLIYLGGWVVSWRSKWFGLERLVKKDRAFSLEMVFEPVADGHIQVDWYLDFGVTSVKTSAVAMDRGYALQSIDIRGAHYLQFRISRAGVNPSLGIFGMGIRFRMTTQRQ